MEMPEIDKPIERKMMQAAMDLFCKYGTKKVSVEEICRYAGVSKMSFYRHFKDKDDITINVLRHYLNERMELFEGILRENIPFEEQLEKIVGIKKERLGTTCDELIKEVMTDRESVPGKVCRELVARQTQRARELFEDFQEKGYIRQDIKLDLVMYLLENLWNALHDKNLLAHYAGKEQLCGELVKATYYGILPGKNASAGHEPK
jgi:AcrR family transcriptional regulator